LAFVFFASKSNEEINTNKTADSIDKRINLLAICIPPWT
jgi:hypothetical protein